MIIERTPFNKDEFEINRKIANEGCDKCPHCGETRKGIHIGTNGKYGILSGLVELDIVHYGFLGLRSKYMCRDLYTCYTCGTKYSSEQYPSRSEYEKKRRFSKSLF